MLWAIEKKEFEVYAYFKKKFQKFQKIFNDILIKITFSVVKENISQNASEW